MQNPEKKALCRRPFLFHGPFSNTYSSGPACQSSIDCNLRCCNNLQFLLLSLHVEVLLGSCCKLQEAAATATDLLANTLNFRLRRSLLILLSGNRKSLVAQNCESRNHMILESQAWSRQNFHSEKHKSELNRPMQWNRQI